ncbi:nucleotidyltransferase family protein [Hyphobacterium sp. CCMP332]|nr:nucleotidyltransferase family protein [Hyphobacterium sp. CCMP332]
MSPKEDLLSKLRNLKSQLAKKYPITAMALFGSFSRGDQLENSDIDILVEIDGKIGSRFIDLAEELESELGRKVDLISKNGIKPRYFNSIEQDLIYV